MDEEPEELPMLPDPPEEPPLPGIILLGRFQPFHRGHAWLLEQALSHPDCPKELPVRIALGSANQPEDLANPWSAEEREQMVRAWVAAKAPHEEARVEVVAIPDIDDPPNWVEHASRYHGGPGIMFTSDAPTAELYAAADWPVVNVELTRREDYEGWRIRDTLQMLSTVSEHVVSLEVACATIPESVSRLIIDNGWHARLAFMGLPVEPVG